MNITIVGAGNVGTQIAVHCAEKKNNVTIFTSKPEKISKELVIVNENNVVIHKGHIHKATSDSREAFEEADLIFVTMPATMMEENADKIETFAHDGLKICLVPGTGGGECAFSKCINKGAVLFAVQRVPSVARLVEYGKKVRAVGYRNELYVAAIPHRKTDDCCKIIEHIFDIKTTAVPNYLNIMLTPSNPIIHTVRLRNLFSDYYYGKKYSSVPLFYEDWNDDTSEMMLQCDEEVQDICKALSFFDLSYVKSLKIHYESSTAQELTNKIKSIKGFKGIKSPVIEVEDGFIPDFTSRYFVADFSYGLSILVQIANLLNVNVPVMNDNLNWYNSLKSNTHEFNFKKFNIYTSEEFISFYSM